MTCSTSSSSRAAGRVAVALVAAALAWHAGPARADPQPPRAPRRAADLPAERPGGGRSSRIALLPPENLTGRDFVPDELFARFEGALLAAGIDVVSGEPVERFLARWRVRSTGGLDGPTAAAARDELGVDAFLVTTAVQRDEGEVPRVSLIVRLVSAEEEPAIYWIDGGFRSGDDHPGLLQLGMVRHLGVLETRELRRLAERLATYLEGRAPRAQPCGGGWLYEPRTAFRNIAPPREHVSSIAVLPLQNRTDRESAGDVLALELTRQLAVSGRFHIREPAVVRAELLRHRVVMEDGVSADTARMALGILGVDYVLAGIVHRYDEARGQGGNPVVDFTVTMLEARTGRVAWQSSSRAQGRDGVLLFDLGYVRSTAELTCRLAREVARGIVGDGAGERRDRRKAAPPAASSAKAARVEAFE